MSSVASLRTASKLSPTSSLLAADVFYCLHPDLKENLCLSVTFQEVCLSNAAHAQNVASFSLGPAGGDVTSYKDFHGASPPPANTRNKHLL